MPKRERILLAVRELKESPFTAPELRQIAEAAEAHGADQLHYALYTHHRESDQPLTEEIVFGHTKRLRLVLLESGDLRDLDSFPDRDLQTEVWQRGCAPRIIHRCFARTADRPRAATGPHNKLHVPSRVSSLRDRHEVSEVFRKWPLFLYRLEHPVRSQ
jgi:hypothetical protein